MVPYNFSGNGSSTGQGDPSTPSRKIDKDPKTLGVPKPGLLETEGTYLEIEEVAEGREDPTGEAEVLNNQGVVA